VDGPGSFAEYVALPAADFNVVPLPDAVSFDVAAGLGCRFATAYRALVQVAKVRRGESVAVLGCGGVGLAAVMVARSRGADVIAVDVDPAALSRARELGAAAVVESTDSADDVAEAVRAMVPGGVDVSVDALGSVATARASVLSLRVQGRHLQVGLLPPAVVGDRATVPMHTVIARELTVLGNHGMPARDYPGMLDDIAAGRLEPGRLLSRVIELEEAPAALAAMGGPTVPGVTIIRP
jgi:alcohol dehydrogenase